MSSRRLLKDRLDETSRKNGSKIILALDFEGPHDKRMERASSLVARVGDRIAGIKINFQILLPFGMRGTRKLVEQCHGSGLAVIDDFKLNDIGSTNLDVIETLFSGGFDAVIVNPIVGYREGMRDVIARSHELGKGVVLLVYMSHAGAREGYGLKVADGEPMYMRFARKTRRWDADGTIVSAKSPTIIRRVRSILARDQLILSPGVGFQGGDAAKATRAGSDYLIVGRAITNSENPSQVVQTFNETLASAL